MFNLQLFGTNDTLTSSKELKLTYAFADGDTRITNLPNPRTNLTATNIQSTAEVLATTQAFVGDKNSAAFTGITSAVIVEQTKRKLDLT